jgi:hypothetical protein
MAELLTISDLCRITGEPPYVVNYAIRLFGPEPTARIGIARVWSRDCLPAIEESLEKTRARSTTRRPAAEGAAS